MAGLWSGVLPSQGRRTAMVGPLELLVQCSRSLVGPDAAGVATRVKAEPGGPRRGGGRY